MQETELENHFKKLWEKSEDQKSWVTSTVRLGFPPKSADEKEIAMQKIHHEMEISKRREKELKKMRSALATQDNTAAKASEQTFKSLEKKHVEVVTPTSLEKLKKFQNPTSSDKNGKFDSRTKTEKTAAEKSPYLTRPCYLNLQRKTVDEKKTPETVTYVYTSKSTPSKTTTRTIPENNKSHLPTTPKVVHKLSTKNSSGSVTPENDYSYFMRRTDEYVNKPVKEKIDASKKNITLVNVNGNQNTPQRKYITQTVIKDYTSPLTSENSKSLRPTETLYKSTAKINTVRVAPSTPTKAAPVVSQHTPVRQQSQLTPSKPTPTSVFKITNAVNSHNDNNSNRNGALQINGDIKQQGLLINPSQKSNETKDGPRTKTTVSFKFFIQLLAKRKI